MGREHRIASDGCGSLKVAGAECLRLRGAVIFYRSRFAHADAWYSLGHSSPPVRFHPPHVSPCIHPHGWRSIPESNRCLRLIAVALPNAQSIAMRESAGPSPARVPVAWTLTPCSAPSSVYRVPGRGRVKRDLLPYLLTDPRASASVESVPRTASLSAHRSRAIARQRQTPSSAFADSPSRHGGCCRVRRPPW